MLRWPVLAVLSVVLVRRLCVIVNVRGNSMRPTYADGDVLFAVRSPLRTGRVVVFRPPLATRDPTNPPYRVKRLIAMAGEATPEGVRGQLAGTPIPPGWLVVRGDNENSEDSRDYGYVAKRNVIAVVVARLRSTDRPWEHAARPKAVKFRVRGPCQGFGVVSDELN